MAPRPGCSQPAPNSEGGKGNHRHSEMLFWSHEIGSRGGGSHLPPHPEPAMAVPQLSEHRAATGSSGWGRGCATLNLSHSENLLKGTSEVRRVSGI